MVTAALIVAWIALSSCASALSDAESAQIARFRQYLRINTSHPNPDYAKASDFILSEAKSIGLSSQVLEFVPGKPVVLLTWQGTNTDLPSVLLNSHMDVVPAEADKWIYPPFEAHKDEQGNIFARGSQDMKCVSTQYLEAVRNLKNKGFVPTRTLHLSFVPDEEIGGEDGTGKFVESEVFRKLNVGVVFDEGVAWPAEGYLVFRGERAAWWLKIKAVGAPGHGSKLYDNSAAENLLKSLESIDRYRASQFDLEKAELAAPGEVVSVNTVFLKAGTPTPTGFTMNVQPSEAEAGFDIRVSPTACERSLERRISEEWAPASRNMTFEFVQKSPVLPATIANDSNPWWTVLERSVLNAGGKLHEPQIAPGSTDARYFRKVGIPAFGFSPMENTPILLHDHNEFLNERVYLKGVKVYEEIIESYASYAELEEVRLEF